FVPRPASRLTAATMRAPTERRMPCAERAPIGCIVLVLAIALGGGSRPASGAPAEDSFARWLPQGASDTNDVPRAAVGFAQARVADNPSAGGATAVGERVCIACHQLESEHFSHTFHALGLHAANTADASVPVCETCHGPGSAH